MDVTHREALSWIKTAIGPGVPSPQTRWVTIPMSIETERGLKIGHTTDEQTEHNAARELTLSGYGAFDARDVLCGRLDDTTVKQAVEGQR